MDHPLKKFRKEQHPQLSQKELADILGKDRLTIHRWETGKRKPGRFDIEKITEKTGIQARDLRPDLVELLGEVA
jgi:transcriptional regulator with XRE-family HTH domain